ncbi:MAG: ATP-dependent helicase DEAD-box [Rhodobacteraceae bacterium]|uniref:DEAD/DEAH box helicase n=1 Tax=Cypionkella sp. TaxID=2811411 RepID=UPI0013243717|nr:DEAD/DEAH box helicase [Cypionkella sp.]KAF0171512.1 MAG: ATP-dependent helicase DEAD-box [Paracoccaceae bacterium]MDO8326754.1 DEAD/DEAH box helicase [Cypionkella sp.]
MTKFSDLALDPRVLKAVAEAGYETPTPIQAQAIPHALAGKDVLGIAQTGTGKTASFTLPMITLLGQGRAKARMPRSLVLCPTRELAAQVAENFDVYAKYTKLTKALLIGGVSFGEQDKLIDRGVDVLIATPGRLLDHHERGKLLLTGVQIMVVDEADRMLDMGFIPDIERIFSLTPFTRQTFFYSATMAPEIERITNTFLTGAVKIEVARQATTSTTIEQKLIQFTPSRKDKSFAEKRAVLRALITAEGESCTNAIIFCNRKMDVDVVAKSLKAHGFNASPIHGDLDQSVRTRTLDGFRDGSVHLLVASDVAARGLDIPAVSHVFNFDAPSHPEDYVHRIGRTGRAGRLGKAYTIAVPSDDKYINAIESLVKQPIPRGEVPEGALEGASDRPERPKEERSSSRSRGGRGDSRSRDRAPREEKREEKAVEAAAAVEAISEPVVEARPERAERQERPRREDTRREDTRRDEPRSEDRREPRPEHRSEPRRDDRRDDRSRDYRGNRDSGERVVGMGDHVPDFILRSFAITTQTADEPEEASATGTEG